MQAVIQRTATAGTTQWPGRAEPADSELITRRLTVEFPALARNSIERCVTDTWVCAQHLGLAVTAHLVERVAREHLLGVVNSVPPSGRPPGTA